MADVEPSENPAPPQDEASSTPGTAWATVPMFAPRRFAWELTRDQAIRWLAIGAIGALLVVLLLFDTGGSAASLIAAVLLVGGWVAISVISARVMRELPGVSALIDTDPAQAEDALARMLPRKPLMRWVRLLLYHRLAAVRHQQGRFAEAATISRAVLDYPLGPGEPSRAHLLLVLAESSLAVGDAASAYHALAGLHMMRLSLTEYLQKLALQTRYEAMIGADASALWAVEYKIAMAELMPAPQSGIMHVLLAQSADRVGWDDMSCWLWARAELLCHPDHLAALRRGESGLGVVGGVPEHGLKE